MDPNRASRGFDVRILGLDEKSRHRVKRTEYFKKCSGSERFILVPDIANQKKRLRVFICFQDGTDLGYLPNDPGDSVYEALLSGAIYVGGFVNTGGHAGGWFHFDRVFPSPDRSDAARVADNELTLWAIQSMARMPDSWAWQRAMEAGVVVGKQPKQPKQTSAAGFLAAVLIGGLVTLLLIVLAVVALTVGIGYIDG